MGILRLESSDDRDIFQNSLTPQYSRRRVLNICGSPAAKTRRSVSERRTPSKAGSALRFPASAKAAPSRFEGGAISRILSAAGASINSAERKCSILWPQTSAVRPGRWSRSAFLTPPLVRLGPPTWFPNPAWEWIACFSLAGDLPARRLPFPGSAGSPGIPIAQIGVSVGAAITQELLPHPASPLPLEFRLRYLIPAQEFLKISVVSD